MHTRRRSRTAAVLVLLGGLGCTSPSATGGPGGHGGGGSGGGSVPVGSGGAGGDDAGGGAGGTGGEQDPTAWLLDDALWSVAPEPSAMLPSMCTFRVASRDALDRFPRLTWEPCGPGCEVAIPTMELGEIAERAAVGSTEEGTSLLALNSILGSGDDRRDLHRVLDLRSGRTLAAIQTRQADRAFLACFLDSSDHDPTVLRASASSDLYTTTEIYGRAVLASGAYLFPRPSFPSNRRIWNCASVALESPGSPMVFGCYSEVVAMLEPGSSIVARVSARTGTATIGAFGEQVVFEEDRGGGISRLLQWSSAEGERPASTDIPGDICAVGVSERLVAGVLGSDRTRPSYSRCAGFYSDLRFVIRGRGTDDLALDLGPRVVESGAAVERLVTRGDFVAASAFHETRDHGTVSLTRTSDWKVRRVYAHDGQALSLDAIGLDDRYLYVVESPGTIGFSRAIAGIYRYDLARFDSIGGE